MAVRESAAHQPEASAREGGSLADALGWCRRIAHGHLAVPARPGWFTPVRRPVRKRAGTILFRNCSARTIASRSKQRWGLPRRSIRTVPVPRGENRRRGFALFMPRRDSLQSFRVACVHTILDPGKGPTLNADQPYEELPIYIGTDGRFEAFRGCLLRLPELVGPWIRLNRLPVAGAGPEITEAYARLMLAFGLARLHADAAAEHELQNA